MPEEPPLPYEHLPEVASFTVESDDIDHGAPIPLAHTAGSGVGRPGDNVSPGLRWSGAPEGTKSFVVTCFDPDAPTGSGFWHWVLVDIPADVTELPAGAGGGEDLPGDAFHVANDAGMKQYVGPFPPPGHGPHRYAFAVHAVDTENLGIDDSVSPAVCGFNLWQHTLGRAVIVPTYAYEE
jgi:Raf kinase inhibitor-like YbhB/YbcL family protein